MGKTFKKILCTLLVVVMCLTCAPLSGFVGLELPDIDFGSWFSSKASAASEGYYTYTITDGEATITDVNTSISGDITIPATLGGYSVTTIGYMAFDNCDSLTSVTIPDSVTTIGRWAFDDCDSLTSVTIGDSVTTIGDKAFAHCDSLTSVTIPDSVTTIGDAPFAHCNKLTSISVDEKNIAYTSDSSGVLFNKDKTMLIQYPAGNKNTSYTIPDSVTTIVDDAFQYCSKLKSVDIPNSVTKIGREAFYGCTSLTSITIPENLTSIDDQAFDDTAWYNAQPDGDVYAGKVYYKYKGKMPENTSIVIKDGTKEIAHSAFEGCNGLTSVIFPNSVTIIKGYAFKDCTSLASIVIPDSVTLIGYGAFFCCYNLSSVIIGKNTTDIQTFAFAGCKNLKHVELGGKVETFAYAFRDCISLASINIPNGIKKNRPLCL